MKIKLRKENDFWGLIPPTESSNAPLLTLNHLTPEADIDLGKLPDWAQAVIEKSIQYGILIVSPEVVEEKKEVTKDETGVESKVKKTTRMRAPKKASIKQ